MKGSYGASLVVRAIGTWATIYGILILIGGPDRWANPAYDVANRMPGSPYTWAVILLIAGIVVLIGSLTPKSLPFPHFSFPFPAVVVKSWTKKHALPVVTVQTQTKLIDWNSTQVRNIGLMILATWWFLFGLALLIGLWQVPNIGYGAGGNQMLLSIICIVMTKVREPVTP